MKKIKKIEIPRVFQVTDIEIEGKLIEQIIACMKKINETVDIVNKLQNIKKELK